MFEEEISRFSVYIRPHIRRIGVVLFADRTGLGLFVFSLLVFIATWRIGFLINDNYTIANTLVAVADGQLHVDEILYGPLSGASPGMYIRDGRLYGRHYGLVFFALPFLWAIEVTSHLIAPRLAVAGFWSASFVALVRYVGPSTSFGQQRPVRLLGYGAGGVFFVLNLWAHESIAARWFPQMALQLSTMVAGALLVVTLYRLIARMYTPRLGVFAAAVAVLASPVTFWATVPKRHTLTALFVVLTLYTFYRCRECGDSRSLLFRALSYALVGLLTWVSPPEGAILFIPLVIADFLTAPSNNVRDVAVLGGVFALSLVPFFLTNVAITGNPIQPPLNLPVYEGSGSVGANTSSPNLSSGQPSDSANLSSAGAIVVELINRFGKQVLRGPAAIADPTRLYRVFLRSGYDGLGLRRFGVLPVNLSFVESMPIAGALLAVPLACYNQLRGNRTTKLSWKLSATRSTDVFALAYALMLLFVYLPALPLHTMFTMRYLHSLYPLCIYFVLRLGLIRRVISIQDRALVLGYASTLLIGGVLSTGVVIVLMNDFGAAVQLHARIAVAAASLLGYFTAVSVLLEEYRRSVAICISFCMAVTTHYLLLSVFVYFKYGSTYGLPVLKDIPYVSLLLNLA
jgi:4-amino-4-deoxy-L-arabinose transferase-like glycosyltransferase